jgi:hypothetical protein
MPITGAEDPRSGRESDSPCAWSTRPGFLRVDELEVGGLLVLSTAEIGVGRNLRKLIGAHNAHLGPGGSYTFHCQLQVMWRASKCLLWQWSPA